MTTNYTNFTNDSFNNGFYGLHGGFSITFITNEFPELLITNVAYVLERFLSNVAYVLESFPMFFAYVLEKSCIFAVKFIYDGTKCTKENY